MATCNDFRKNGRGRPSLELKCSVCNVEYRSHGKAIVPALSKPNFIPVVSISIIENKATSKPHVSAEHLLELFANQSIGLEDW